MVNWSTSLEQTSRGDLIEINVQYQLVDVIFDKLSAQGREGVRNLLTQIDTRNIEKPGRFLCEHREWMDGVRVKVIGNDWRGEGIPERSKRVDVDFSILDVRLHAKAKWAHCSRTDDKPGVEIEKRV